MFTLVIQLASYVLDYKKGASYYEIKLKKPILGTRECMPAKSYRFCLEYLAVLERASHFNTGAHNCHGRTK